MLYMLVCLLQPGRWVGSVDPNTEAPGRLSEVHLVSHETEQPVCLTIFGVRVRIAWYRAAAALAASAAIRLILSFFSWAKCCFNCLCNQ